MMGLPNQAEEDERMLLTPAGCCCETQAWLGKRAFGRLWSPESLAAAIASGAIIEPATDRSPSASWARVLGVVGFGLAAIAIGTYPLWWPR